MRPNATPENTAPEPDAADGSYNRETVTDWTRTITTLLPGEWVENNSLSFCGSSTTQS